MKTLNLLPKSNILFNRTPGTMANITGLVNQSEMSIVELKTLENLTHNSIGVARSATPSNPQVVAVGGTAVFRVVKLQEFSDYTKANRDDAGNLPASEIKVKINITKSAASKYELETLDLAGLGFGSREAFVSFVASGITKSLAAYLDAHYIDIFLQDAKAKEAASSSTPVLVKNADFADLNDDTKRTTAYRQVARAKVEVARQLNKYDIGSNTHDYNTLLHQNITNDLLLAMPKGGNTATDVGRGLSGMDGTTSIAGLGIVKDHLFFGINIPKGTSFAGDTDFDFSKVYGLTAHKEAAFLAVQSLMTTGTIDPNSANQKYITKFNLFKGMVRDGLYRLYTTGTLQ